MLRISEKIHVGSETDIRLRIRNQVKCRIRIRKIIPDPQHWLLFLGTGMVLLRVRHTLWIGQVFTRKNIEHKSVFESSMGRTNIL